MLTATKEFMASIEKKANGRKEKIFNSKPELSHVTGTKYYVSNNGNDENDGKSPEAAWATLDKVNGSKYTEGDAVLFECGGKWRGQITGGDKKGVTFSSYGTGAKPLLIGAERNSADASLWEQTDVPNVYKYTIPVVNPGHVAFIDAEGNVTMSTRLFRLEKKIAGSAKLDVLPDTYKNLTDDLQFWCDFVSEDVHCFEGWLYLYSAHGNPAERFADIEVTECKGNVINWSDGITVDGLEVRYNGRHGIAGGNANNVTVRNCVIQYVGGSLMGQRDTVFGNALEMYGPCNGFVLENNYINEIYDTGVTFQCGAGYRYDSEYKNIRFSGNLIERCHWSIEFYNQVREGNVRTVDGVEITDNICRYAGMGWGSRFRTAENGYFLNETRANHICSWGLAESVENFSITDNVFDEVDGFVIRLSSDKYGPGDKKVDISNNTYIVSRDTPLAKVGGVYQSIEEFTRDTSPVIAVTE